MDAFGSNSEPEEKNEQWVDTSMSECENDHEEDIVELACSDINEELHNLEVGKIHTEQIIYDELAQFQRQVAAALTSENTTMKLVSMQWKYFSKQRAYFGPRI